MFLSPYVCLSALKAVSKLINTIAGLFRRKLMNKPTRRIIPVGWFAVCTENYAIYTSDHRI